LYLATEINDYSLSQLQLDRLEMALTKIKPEERSVEISGRCFGKTLQEVLGLSESAK
jgi:hypothetical protein